MLKVHDGDHYYGRTYMLECNKDLSYRLLYTVIFKDYVVTGNSYDLYKKLQTKTWAKKVGKLDKYSMDPYNGYFTHFRKGTYHRTTVVPLEDINAELIMMSFFDPKGLYPGEALGRVFERESDMMSVLKNEKQDSMMGVGLMRNDFFIPVDILSGGPNTYYDDLVNMMDGSYRKLRKITSTLIM